MSEETTYKINISAGKDAPKEFKGQTHTVNIEPAKFPLVGKVVGETFNGSLIALPGYELLITGGSDNSGIPLRKDVHGPMKKRLLLSRGPGFRPSRKGMKRRKIVRGSEITDEVTLINTVVVKFGKEKLFTPKEEGESKE